MIFGVLTVMIKIIECECCLFFVLFCFSVCLTQLETEQSPFLHTFFFLLQQGVNYIIV